MKRLICAALVLVSAQALAYGQQDGGREAGEGGPPAFVRVGDVGAEAARLLRSEADAERAWGAYLAGLHGLKGHATAVVGLLTDPSLGDSWEDTLVRQAALDALIRLDADVPAEVLRALPRAGFADEIVILAARAPGEHAALLLEMFAEWDGEGRAGAHWLAAGNLLAGAKAHGFAAQLLKGLKVEAYVVVRDADEDTGFGTGGGYGCGCGGDFYTPPEGFPPVSFYSLTADLSRGAVVVAPGRHPVYQVSSRAPGGRGGCGFSEPREKDTARVEYLATLLDTYEGELALNPRPTLVVVCKAERQCRGELAGARGGVERAYAALVGRLVEKNLLGGAGDAPPAPDITFTLSDRRRQRPYPLPTTLRGVKVLVESVEEEAPAEVEP